MKFWALKISVLLFGLMILFISTTRASLDFLESENRDDEIRNNPFVFQTVNRNGGVEQQIYKFTSPGMLPDNLMYGIKRMRDVTWLTLSNGLNKARVALLLGDKRMIEADGLLKKNKEKLAIKTANAAIDKLQYADYLNNNRDKHLQKQIALAGFAYREMLGRRDKIEDVNSQDWAKLIQRIDDWNKKVVEKI